MGALIPGVAPFAAPPSPSTWGLLHGLRVKVLTRSIVGFSGGADREVELVVEQRGLCRAFEGPSERFVVGPSFVCATWQAAIGSTPLSGN